MAKHQALNAHAVYDHDIDSPSEIYHENSKMRRYEGIAWGKRFEAIRANPDLVKAMSKAFKVYPNAEQISLPRSLKASSLSVEEVMTRRRTVRDFAPTPVTLEELGQFLYLSYGISFAFRAFPSHTLYSSAPRSVAGMDAIDTALSSDAYQTFRTAASGGGLYPLEIYPVIFRGKDVDPGLYHYSPKYHSLELLRSGDFRKDMMDMTFNQSWQEDASIYFIITALFDRTKFKYYERGYRFVMLDTGAVMQNMYLAATSLSLGGAAIGGFYDDEIHSFLDIDGVNEAAVCLYLLGNPNPDAAKPEDQGRLVSQGRTGELR